MEESFQKFTNTDLKALSRHNLLRNVDLESLERKSRLPITIERRSPDQDRVEKNRQFLEKLQNIKSAFAGEPQTSLNFRPGPSKTESPTVAEQSDKEQRGKE